MSVACFCVCQRLFHKCTFVCVCICVCVCLHVYVWGRRNAEWEGGAYFMSYFKVGPEENVWRPNYVLMCLTDNYSPTFLLESFQDRMDWHPSSFVINLQMCDRVWLHAYRMFPHRCDVPRTTQRPNKHPTIAWQN